MGYTGAVLQIRENVPLGPLTTLGIGGPARYFADTTSEKEVAEAMSFAADTGVRVVVMGGGSNLLVSDSGFSGLILRVAIGGTRFTDAGPHVLARAGAGVDWDGFVAHSVGQNLAGVECLSGIPGWVGGTPVQNVGAYGQEVSAVIEEVRVFDRQSGRGTTLDNDACGFAYRKSVFNTTARGRYIVLGVVYRLEKMGAPLVLYPDLVRKFGQGPPPSLQDVRDAVRRIRAEKAMLIDPASESADTRSAGSFFKNPVLCDREFYDLVEISSETPPSFAPPSGGGVKVSAAWLIERSGFPKGFQRGRVGLSTRHALALVNRGGATAAEVLEFAREIQSAVLERFGVAIRPEPVFLGFTPRETDGLGAIECKGG
jgi:UDP-N-acetylmuramate dehydrogenase